MKLRKLGNTGIKLSEVGIGTWEMAGDVWGAKDDAESIRAIESGIKAGANFIDTAIGYGRGHVESLIGRLLKSGRVQRSDLVISTKIPPQCGQFAPPPERNISEFYSPSHIREQCEASLKRLQTDYIDILFMHTWSRAWGHETKWWEEMKKLKDEGKIRAIGISIPDEGITDANVHIACGRADVIQCVYSVFQQEPEYSLFPLAQQHGVGIIARSPFSSGALVQQWKSNMTFPKGDWRASWPLSVKPGWLEEQVKMAEEAKPILAKSGRPFSQAALKYVLQQSAISSVIPGSGNPAHVVENMAASDQPNLPEEIITELRLLWQNRKIHGTYNGSI